MWQLIPMAIGAMMGARAAENKASQKQRMNLAQAETSRYSPWTHMQGQLDSSYSPDALEGGFSGGVQGLGMAQSIGGAFPDLSSGGASTPPSSGQSYLGGSDMASQLGQSQIGQASQGPSSNGFQLAGGPLGTRRPTLFGIGR